MNYQDMMGFMAKARNISKGRPTGQRGTRIQLQARHGESVPTIVQLVYHNTPLINWHPSGQIIFSNNGWNTRTTIARMNEYLSHYNYRIITRKGIKYLRCITDTTSFNDHELGTVFRIFFEHGNMCLITDY